MADVRFEGIRRLHTARDVVEQQGTIDGGYAVAREAAAAFHALLRQRFARAPGDHHLRAVLAGPGGHPEAPGPRGHLPRWLGDLGQGLGPRGPGSGPRQLSVECRARGGRRHRPRPAHGRSQPGLRPQPDDPGRASGDAGRGLPAVHHRRRRHRPRRRRPCPQPHPALRRGRRAGLPHRGPAAGCQEVRPPGRQGPGRGPRAAQAAQRGTLPAGRHARPGDHRGPHRRRGRDAPGRPQRRARRAVPAGLRRPATCRAIGSATWPSCDCSARRGWRMPVATSCSRCPRRTIGRRSPGWRRTGWSPRCARPRPTAGPDADIGPIIEALDARFAAAWSAAAGLMTRDEAADLGVDDAWDPELPRTVDGYYRVRGGIDYAIARSIAAAPFADLLWMETKTADLADARRFAEAVHAVYPDAMLAYNLSPSFNWDTTGMSDEEMRRFPEELGPARLRVRLHHLRRAPGRWPGGRGVRGRAAARRDARPGPAAAPAAAARVAVSDAAGARRRGAAGCRPDRRHRADGQHPGHGRGVDPSPAPRRHRGAAGPPGALARRRGPRRPARPGRSASDSGHGPPGRTAWSWRS